MRITASQGQGEIPPGYEGEIILFEAAARELKRLDVVPCPPPSGSGPRWTSSPPDGPPCNRNIGSPAGGAGVRHPPPECGGPVGKAKGSRTAETGESRTGIGTVVRFARLFKSPGRGQFFPV